jgi:hypothetical protein
MPKVIDQELSTPFDVFLIHLHLERLPAREAVAVGTCNM